MKLRAEGIMDKQASIAIGGVVLMGAMLGGIFLATGSLAPRASGNSLDACRGGQVAGDMGGPLSLMDETGATVTDADFVTEPTILYFGYTFCPDVCPLDNMRNAFAVEELAARGISATPVFVTIDPERDTPEVVGEFAENFHDKMIGLTGTPEQIAAASAAYKTYYRAHEDDGSGFYLVDHSTFSYLVMPEIGFVDFFRRETTPEEMADRVQCFVEAAQ